MLEQQEQLRALQGRQEALIAMQESAEQAIAVIEDTGKLHTNTCRVPFTTKSNIFNANIIEIADNIAGGIFK